MLMSIMSPATKKRIKMLDAVFFDLDGTLFDTALDIATALNHVLVFHGYKPRPFDFIRPTIGLGSIGIICHGFGIKKSHYKVNQYKQELLAAYQQCLTDRTRYFTGMDAIIEELDNKKITWGIITNKPLWLALPLVKHYKLTERAACIIGGNCLPKRKPDPSPLLYACAQSGVAPTRCLYVGDTLSDHQASKKAGMTSVITTWGYRYPNNNSNHPLRWNADHVIDTASELSAIINTNKQQM